MTDQPVKLHDLPWCPHCQSWHLATSAHYEPDRPTSRLARSVNKLRSMLRTWLGVERDFEQLNKVADFAWAINGVVLGDPERGVIGLTSVSRDQGQAIENLQAQIDDFRTVASPTPKADEPDQPIIKGFTRFSQRKRQYEFDHRKPVVTPAGQQIEENARQIAAGQRKPTQ